MTRRWMRFRSATLMILIALIALGLGAYRWYQATFVQPLFDRAGVVLREILPETDLDRLDARLAATSGNGLYQQVLFRDKVTGKTTTVTIPIVALDLDRPSDSGMVTPAVQSNPSVAPRLLSTRP